MTSSRLLTGPDEGDAGIVVLGVELRQELVVINIASTLIDAVRYPTPQRKLPRVGVTDDLGTTYRGKGLEHYGSSWSGNPPVAHYAMEFRPAVPPAARYLKVTFGTMVGKNRDVIVML